MWSCLTGSVNYHEKKLFELAKSIKLMETVQNYLPVFPSPILQEMFKQTTFNKIKSLELEEIFYYTDLFLGYLKTPFIIQIHFSKSSLKDVKITSLISFQVYFLSIEIASLKGCLDRISTFLMWLQSTFGTTSCLETSLEPKLLPATFSTLSKATSSGRNWTLWLFSSSESL